MATTSSAAVLAACVLAAAGTARAECPEAPSFDITSATYTALPAPPGDGARGLGLDLTVRAMHLAWGRACRDGLGHHLGAVTLEAPDYGDPASRFVRFGTYRVEVRRGEVAVLAGLTALTLWPDSVRLATPVAALRWHARAADVRVELGAALAGLYAAAFGRDRNAGPELPAPPAPPRRWTTDVALAAAAAWPARAATRGELRLRARDYTVDGMRAVRELTATAGVGLALVARDGVRAVPGFAGVSVRRAGEHTDVMLTVELSLGLGAP